MKNKVAGAESGKCGSQTEKSCFPDGKDNPGSILLVDDEEKILSSLKRLLRPQGYTIYTAAGGIQGLEILAQQEIDLVISDMRMPEMDGASFLSKVAEQWPETIRMLLTGYTDLTSTIEAINKGHIYRYLNKPWEDIDVSLTIKHAIERKRLEQERWYLAELTQKQNVELKELNASLESKVAARTKELSEAAASLEAAFEQLKSNYRSAVSVFFNLLELRESIAAGHGQRVGELAAAIARNMGMKEEAIQDIYFAGLLHDIGKIGLPDNLLNTPAKALPSRERKKLENHPVMGQAALMALEPLHAAAAYIRSHHERYDGKGYPDKLAGEAIPLGARILAVANDYDSLQIGTLTGERVTTDQAISFIDKNKGQRYDPQIVAQFVKVIENQAEEMVSADEVRLGSDGLKEGMILSRDLKNAEGILLLPKGRQITLSQIERLRIFERDSDQHFACYVKRESSLEQLQNNAG